MKGKEIKGYPNYFITENGEVWSNKKNRLRKLKPQVATQNKRYHQVRLFSEQYPKGRLQYVHRLVYETYIGKIENDMTIDHIDHNTENNSYNNLQLLTRSDNSKKQPKNKKQNWSRQPPNPKLDLWKLQDKLVKLYESGISQPKLSKMYSCSEATMYRIINKVER